MNVDGVDLPDLTTSNMLQIAAQLSKIASVGAIDLPGDGFDQTTRTFTIIRDQKRVVLSGYEAMCFTMGAASMVELFAGRLGVELPPRR